jgi:ubiquinone/menaquinone biosynthesis C-methylase UbiE
VNKDASTIDPQRKATFGDHFALWTLKLAKLRQRSFENTNADYSAFYEDYFKAKDVEQYEQDARMAVRRETINKYLAKYAAPGAKLLDCGCGLGDVLWGLPDGYDLHAFDFADNNVKVAKFRLGNRAEIRQGSLYEIPYPDASFDVALCTEVLEHLEHDDKAVGEIARILKPGGFLIAAVPYQYYWPDYLRLMGHFRHYTRQSFSRLLSDKGLVPEIYLENFPNWNTKYTRKYVFVRAKATVFGRLFGRKSAYDFKWPWLRERSIERAKRKIEPLRRHDAQLDYNVLDTSTFILARKKS